jgi:hypothetical protein
LSPSTTAHVALDEGFHAWIDARDAWKALGETYDAAPHMYLAVGKVCLWGEVSLEQESVRATRAYPLELWTTFDPETNRYVARAAQRYGLDVVVLPLECCDVA